ncbi:MAG TPA: glycosyltransferase [Acidimicrobiales bacterium]|nr:glycosyltransferase [Acidimicrobiales bacterium]
MRPRRFLARANRRLESEWTPVPMLRIDLEEGIDQLPPAAPAGSLAWVEAFAQGQLVGVIEARREVLRSESAWRARLDDLPEPACPPSETVPDAVLPAASVVVPSIVRSPTGLRETVTSLLALDYPRFEVLVVDNRPAPSGPIPGLPDDPRVHVLSEDRPGISAARNVGIARASGQFVAFIDDDATAETNWLRAFGTRFFLEPDVDGIGGIVLPKELDAEPQLWFEEYYGGFRRSFGPERLSLALTSDGDALFPYAPGRFGTGCNMAFRTATLREHGGFNTALGTGTPSRGGEDLAMFIDLILGGSILAFEPGAIVRHSHLKTPRDFLRHVFSYGTGLSAMYTALVIGDHSQIGAIARRFPAGLRLFMRPRARRLPSSTPHYPRRAVLYEVAGMTYGPLAYLRSALRSRRTS